MPSNRFIFGFTSIPDLLSTLYKVKSYTLHAVSAATIYLAHAAGFIYSPVETVYILFLMMCADWATGAYKAFKKGTFNSFTFQRMLLNMFLTFSLIGVSTQLVKAMWVFALLKLNEVLMTGFLLTYFVSLIENLHAIDNRIIPDKLFAYIQQFLHLDNVLKRFFEPKVVPVAEAEQEPEGVPAAPEPKEEAPIN